MLGKTAGGLYWMARYLERCENTARLVEAGFRIALTRNSEARSEWKSVITTAGVRRAYDEKHDRYDAAGVVDYLLRDADNPSSVISAIEQARTNARMVRTALTTEVWESVNETWMALKSALEKPINETELPDLLGTIRRQNALVRGSFHGTMLRNDIYDFAQIGTALERADNTARIIDVKYFTLLPSAGDVGTSIDNVQWESLLRSLSAHRAYRWLNEAEMTSAAVADFLILDIRFPRSLVFCSKYLAETLTLLTKDYGEQPASFAMATDLRDSLKQRTIASIFEMGMHQFIGEFLSANNAVGQQIEQDYRFSN